MVDYCFSGTQGTVEGLSFH